MKLKVDVIVILIGTVMLISSCHDRDKAGKLLDTPTSGFVKMAVDASLQPLVVAEVDAFEAIYQNADVETTFTSEAKAIDALLKDSVKLVVITRKLLPDELQILMDQKIVAQQVVIAQEGVSLIVHPENSDSTLHISELEEILKGKINKWKQLDPSSSLGDVQLVFDQPDAGIVRFLHDSVYAFQQLPPNCFGVNSDSAVIDYVSKNINSVGLIGVSWISDRDDSTVNKFLSIIRVAGLSKGEEFYQPYQAYIAQGKYPLTRDVVMISREARTGLASGFMSFVAGDKGQRIVLKAGLVPSTMPLRIVEVNHEPF